MRDAQLLIDALHARNPGAVELAKLASIAVQAEPELLRALRLRLLPDVDVGAEGDLWLSELVDSKSPLTMVLDPLVQHRLQQLLAIDPEMVDKAAKIVREAHAGIEAPLRAEETVIALALKGGEGAPERIQTVLGPLIATLERARDAGLAGWATRAFRELPAAAQATEAATRLLLAGSTGSAGEAEYPRIRVGVRMLATTVEIFVTGERDPRLRIIEVPDIGVVVLDLSWGRDERPERVAFAAGEVVRRPRQSDQLLLTTVLGDTYVVSLNAAAEDWALVIGHGAAGARAAQEMTEWLTSPDGGRIPREQVVAHPDALTNLTGEWRRAILYYAGDLEQDGDDLVIKPGIRVRELVQTLRRRRFREVVVIADGRGEPLDVPFEKWSIVSGTARPVAVLGATVSGDASVGELTRALLRVLRGGPGRGSHLSIREVRDLVMSAIEPRLLWFSAGEINLVEPRSGVFEIRLDVPPEWREKRIRLIDSAGEVEQELRPLRRKIVRLMPPGLYFIEIPELSFSKPVIAGLRGWTNVSVRWEPRDAWILVGGSGAYHMSDEENQMVRAMARKLAGAGFRLVVGGREGVDYVAAEDYTKTLQTFGQGNAEFLRQYSVVQPHYHGGPHIPEQRPVDIVRAAIIIGGRDGTRSYVRRADQAGVPIIPIAGTGNVAEEIYNSFAARDKLPEWLTTRTSDEETADGMAERVIRYLETIYRS